VRGVNTVGLRRAGLSDADIEAIEEACRQLFYRDKDKPFAVVMGEFHATNGLNAHVRRMLDFLSRRDQGRHGRYLESFRTH